MCFYGLWPVRFNALSDFTHIYYRDSTISCSAMFSSSCLITSLVLLVSTVASSALPSLPNLISGSSNVPATSHPLAAINTSQQDLKSSALSYNPECSSLYGFLNFASCQNALAKISRATLPLTFGQRGTGNWDVVLPRRYLSGMLFPNRHE